MSSPCLPLYIRHIEVPPLGIGHEIEGLVHVERGANGKLGMAGCLQNFVAGGGSACQGRNTLRHRRCKAIGTLEVSARRVRQPYKAPGAGGARHGAVVDQLGDMEPRLRREPAVELGFQPRCRNDQRIGTVDEFEAAGTRVQDTFIGPEEAVGCEEAIADVVDHHLIAIPADRLQVLVAAQLDDDRDVGVFAVSQLDVPRGIAPPQLGDALCPQARGRVRLERVSDGAKQMFNTENAVVDAVVGSNDRTRL